MGTTCASLRADAAKAVNRAHAKFGLSTSDWAATGVSIDTRSLSAGELFVALRGPNHDGHDFVGAALERDAAAAMVDREIPDLPATAPLLRVADTLAGLTALGAAARKRTGARILAITGSVVTPRGGWQAGDPADARR
jgi:UDP-N-acetylmuramyl pentapeptide synthase